MDAIAKRMLYDEAIRAGLLLQDLFYIYIEKTWTVDINEIEHQHFPHDGVNVVVGAGFKAGPGGQSENPRTAGGWFVEMPAELQNQRYDHAREALLADGNSLWAFIVMHVAVKVLFKDLVNDVEIDIKEVNIKRRHDRYPLVTYYDSPRGRAIHRTDQIYANETSMGVFEIELKSGNKIALNLAGAQYANNHNHLTTQPWSDFFAMYGTEIHQRDYSAMALNFHTNALAKLNKNSHLVANMYMLEHFNAWLKDIEKCSDFLFETLVYTTTPLAFLVGRNVLNKKAKAFLSARAMDISNGTATSPIASIADLRHPTFIKRTQESSVFYSHGREMIMPNFHGGYGGITNFNWQTLKDIVKSRETSYKEKAQAREFLSMRCVYQPWDDWRFLFLPSVLPPVSIPEDRVSVNPFWDARKLG